MATDPQQVAYARVAFTLADQLRRERARYRRAVDLAVTTPSGDLVSAVKQFGDGFIAATIPPADVVSQIAHLAAAALPELRTQAEPPRQLALHLVAACHERFGCGWCRTALDSPPDVEQIDERDLPMLEAFQRSLDGIRCPVHEAAPVIRFRRVDGSIPRFEIASCCAALGALVADRYGQVLTSSGDS